MSVEAPLRITLQDVADAAGVSVSTASRALSGKAEAYRISEETARSVRQAAQGLGFQPSRVARSLRSQRTGLIGVVVPDVSNPFFSSIAREITFATEAAGYSVLLADSQDETAREIKLLTELQSRQVEALVVCPVGMEHQHLLDIHHSGLPLVLADRTFPDSELLQVTSEHRAGAARATALLTAKGHRSIGLLQGLRNTLPNDARLDGVREQFQKVGIRFDERLVAGDHFTEQSGYDSAQSLLQQFPEITALFAFSMPNALGALRAVRDLGRQVPEDLSLVAFDDTPFADFLQVPISTVAQDVQSLGRRTGELVLRRLKGGRRPRKTLHQISIRVQQRDSIREVPH